MLDPKKCADILYKHFAEVTPEQFVENLKNYCPEVFEDDIASSAQAPLFQQDESETASV
ncbi:MAG TPA: hypothetical protein V6D12_12045 [Candidatus Obscuribacterales bacterium]